MTERAIRDLWWKDAVIYSVDVKTFLDTDGDGMGDLAGLTKRLDYLRDLGVNCLWLLPVYPSPLRDDGYDVSDYYSIDPRLGNPGDFVDLVRTAHAMGIRVLLDLVLNHTSDQHPWFVSACDDPGGRFRDFFVWQDEPPAEQAPVVFPGEQESTWTYHEGSGQWYFHRYFEHMPDLNIVNPAVRDEMKKIIGFWLELGVDGFRLDSLPFLIEKETDPEIDVHHEYLRELRSFMSRRRGDAIFVGEANVPVKEQREYFGDSQVPYDASQAHMLFDFVLQATVWLALARGDAEPVRAALRRRPPIPVECQYAVFLRHHDELSLEHGLTQDERQEVFDVFDADGAGQIYGRGLRRRMAPMLDGDPGRVRSALALLTSLPGTPILMYGDEIGLGDDLELSARTSVRVPMQWTDQDNAGFSAAPADRLFRPVREDGQFGSSSVNVARQAADPDSQLNFVKQLLTARGQCPEIGNGEFELIDAGEPAVLALRYRWEGGCVVVVHNLGAESVRVRLDGSFGDERATVVMAESGLERRGVPGKLDEISLDGYGFNWLRVEAGPSGSDRW